MDKDSEREDLRAKKEELDKQIDSERRKIANYNDVKDGFDSLANKFDECFELFRDSMQGDTSDDLLCDLENANLVFHKDIRNTLDSRINTANRNIDDCCLKKKDLKKILKD